MLFGKSVEHTCICKMRYMELLGLMLNENCEYFVLNYLHNLFCLLYCNFLISSLPTFCSRLLFFCDCLFLSIISAIIFAFITLRLSISRSIATLKDLILIYIAANFTTVAEIAMLGT